VGYGVVDLIHLAQGRVQWHSVFVAIGFLKGGKFLDCLSECYMLKTDS